MLTIAGAGSTSRTCFSANGVAAAWLLPALVLLPGLLPRRQYIKAKHGRDVWEAARSSAMYIFGNEDNCDDLAPQDLVG